MIGNNIGKRFRKPIEISSRLMVIEIYSLRIKMGYLTLFKKNLRIISKNSNLCFKRRLEE